ncbi:Protein CBR-UBC-21 [Caenorhabditis briggsae]|uniref:E2 ubiquitin-conjugating enzyme n=2 Tax=Caenorhabditis briggsae TaxID=6238 RepID=A0AAE9CVN9_CAEBR|nr:Protein CBR-UBC-21 [Caenorhabditis briggsae]ULT83865.1 hypothetical protein L3Y34_012871 [Caenorhabditis briggsae]UMM43118.1 hypothetical protein L5515_018721 [Caenorhabditis briggsae]CAP33756.2 Protein CBR-UBC-21 [Caenorhabditis briggsae]
MSNIAMTRVTRECKEVAQASDITEAGIHVEMTDNNITDIKGLIKGPDDTPYADGMFEVHMSIPDQYPFEPPKVKFVTRVWHPNVSSQTGAICLDILKDKWAASLTLRTVLLSIQAMMCAPEPSDPQDAVVAKQYISNYPMFKATATYWTSVFADSKREVDKDFQKKVNRLVEMGIREGEAIGVLSCNNWKLEKAVQYAFG